MGSRLKLQERLEEVLGSKNVYFQPPPSLKMKFPCIVYERARYNTDFADNKPYKIDKAYYATVIYTDPDYDVPDKMSWLPLCVHQRHYEQDNKYYDQFRIVF